MLLFPDTHFFLHFKHPQDVPWGDLTQAEQITLVVGRTVQKEIEKHKFELRGRPQDRARTYSTKLADIIINGKPEVLRESKPQVTLDYNVDREASWELPSGLDPAWGDDLLIADVLAFCRLKPNANVAILTGDPGLIAKAKHYSVTVLSLAGRGWELPAEKSQEQKELEKLRRENEELKRAGPVINCVLEIEQAQDAHISLGIIRYPALTQQLLESLVNEATTRHPRVTDFSAPSSDFEPPPQEQVDAYLKSYDAWHADLHAFLREAAPQLSEKAAEIDLSLVFHNEGNEPASGVRLSIEAVGGFFLSEVPGDDDEERDEKVRSAPVAPKPGKFRAPPSPPRPNRIVKAPPQVLSHGASSVLAKHISEQQRALKALGPWGSASELQRLTQFGREYERIHAASADIARLSDPFKTVMAAHVTQRPLALSPFITNPARLIPKPKDRHAFYWHDTPKRTMVDRWTFDCEEFQHRMDPEVFNVRLTGTYDGKPQRRGAIRVRLSARNMRRPFEATFPIHLDAPELDLSEAMKALLP